MKQNTKIAKELMKIAELLINETNEDEMFEKLYDKSLDVNHRQEIINYFMKTKEGLESLCFDDFFAIFLGVCGEYFYLLSVFKFEKLGMQSDFKNYIPKQFYYIQLFTDHQNTCFN